MYKNSTVEALTELGAIRYGVVQPGKHFEGGIPILKSGDISNSRVNTSSEFRIAPDISSKYKRSILKGGEVLITLVGNPGIVAIAPSDVEGFNVARAVGILDVIRGVDRRFFSYALQGREAQQQINSLLNTTVQATLNLSDLKKIELPVPLLPDQKAIAHILGTLDDKIELNKKMNQTLEEIAKAIFKSWFVNFDPARAKAESRPTGLPPEISDLFPDELVDSEIGEIPKGWEVGALSDVANIIMGQSPPGDTYNDDGVGLPFYQGSTDFGFRFPSLRKYCSEPKRLADADDVLMSVRAPVGDLNRAKDDCCIGRGLASIRTNKTFQSWIFYRCKFLSRQLETFNSEGTVFGSINGKDLKGLPTIIAPDQLLKSFNDIATPIDDGVKNRTQEIEVLSELRDTLLPKLISGELHIPDAEKFLEEAGI